VLINVKRQTNTVTRLPIKIKIPEFILSNTTPELLTATGLMRLLIFPELRIGISNCSSECGYLLRCGAV
jgi:hypothetical protein